MLPSRPLDVQYYVDSDGHSPFADWFRTLDAVARTKVTVAVTRIRQGNLSNAKSVGSGVMEYRIHFGSGYRLYFGREGDTVVILLEGGTKRRQERDIRNAQALWDRYKQAR